MKEGLENLRRALGDKVADRKDIECQIRQSTQDRGGNRFSALGIGIRKKWRRNGTGWGFLIPIFSGRDEIEKRDYDLLQ